VEGDRIRLAAEVEYGELPELTRTLRALGSARQTGGSLQSQFFFPLLDARRRAAELHAAPARIRVFDAEELRRALDRLLDKIVSAWSDERPSARRALLAELYDRVGDYTRALGVLSQRAASALAADEASRVDTWRAWTVQLAATFDTADRGWLALRSIAEALQSNPRPRPR